MVTEIYSVTPAVTPLAKGWIWKTQSSCSSTSLTIKQLVPKAIIQTVRNLTMKLFGSKFFATGVLKNHVIYLMNNFYANTTECQHEQLKSCMIFRG